MASLVEAAASVEGNFTVNSCKEEGVPDIETAAIVGLANRLKIDGSSIEPLADPLTLLRFLRARDGKVEPAAKMYRSTLEWRRKLGPLMDGTYGGGETPQYNESGIRTTDASQWVWSRSTSGNEDANLMQRIGFWGRLSSPGPDDAPIAIWRVGKADLAGFKNNDLVDKVCDAFACHLEDLMQAGRAASLQHKKMVRARLVIDVGGVGMSTLPLLKTLRAIISIGKAFFPEVTASATIINAPWVFSTLWNVVKPLLTKVMQDKVCILSTSWKIDAFTKHSGIALSALPECLGGSASDAELCQCETVAPK